MDKNRHYIGKIAESMFREDWLRFWDNRGRHPENLFKILINLIFLFCLAAPAISQATSATITWNRNQEPDMAGYRIYYGTQRGQYTNSFTVFDSANEPLEHSYVIDGLDESTTYHIAIKAFDQAGQESDYSDEVTLKVAAAEPSPGDDGSWWNSWYGSQDFLEVGEVDIDHQWQTVTLDRQFQNPVVIVGPPTRNGSDPCVVRVRNVISNSFDLRIQEWHYLDGWHMVEHVSYLVVEAGEHLLPDGTLLQADTYALDGTLKWKPVAFGTSFLDNPLIFQTPQSYYGTDTITTRLKSISPDGFIAALQEEEKKNDGHVKETIGYVAMVPGSSELALFEIGRNHIFGPLSDSVTAQVALEEEKSRDTETWHIEEYVGVFLIGDHIFAQIQTFFGPDTAALRMK